MTFNGELFPYQQDAFEQMVDRKKILLAFTMGSGKTPLTLAACEHLMDTGDITAPVLIVALSSLKYQWARQIEHFTDSNPLVIDGTPAVRATQYATAFEYQITYVDYVIVNYEQVVNDWDHIAGMTWGAIVADEATAIKGFRAKRTRAMKKLGSRVDIRFALTGTPIENGKPEEIFSIMEFVNPEVLGRFDRFDRTFIVRNAFGAPARYRNISTLHKTLEPHVLRKRPDDPDVAKYLPTLRLREPFLIPMDSASMKLYEVVRSDLLDNLDVAAEMQGFSTFSLEAHYGQASDNGGPMDALRGEIMAQVTALRMVCNYPALIAHSAADYHRMLAGEKASGSAYAADLVSRGYTIPSKDPNKMKAVVKYVNEFLSLDERNKVVIFAGLLGVVRRLGEHWPDIAQTFTGQMTPKVKDAAITRFRTDPSCRILVSSDAGGFGVDLPEANLLINFDLPWSAGAAAQRNTRIVRASSEFDFVTIDNFLAADSIELRQYQMLLQKIRVSDAVIDGRAINAEGGVDLTVGTLRDFLAS